METSFIQLGINPSLIWEGITLPDIDGCSKSKVLVQNNSPPCLFFHIGNLYKIHLIFI